MLLILIAEDDENDIALLWRAIEKAGFHHPVHVCRNGEEALAYLQGIGEYADRSQFPFPNMIFTDLKMPRKGGLEVLQWLQEHPECRVIPVIVLSASNEDQDVSEAYKLGANCYLRKPTTLEELQVMIKSALDFWSICEKPKVIGTC